MKNVFWYLFTIGLTLNLTGTIDWDWYLIIAPLIFGAVSETAIAIQDLRVKRAIAKANEKYFRKTPAHEQRIAEIADHKRRIANHIKDR